MWIHCYSEVRHGIRHRYMLIMYSLYTIHCTKSTCYIIFYNLKKPEPIFIVFGNRDNIVS